MDDQEVADDGLRSTVPHDWTADRARMIRLECIKLASARSQPLQHVLADAAALTAFVLDGTVPEAKQPTHAPSGARIGPIEPPFSLKPDPLGR